MSVIVCSGKSKLAMGRVPRLLPAVCLLCLLSFSAQLAQLKLNVLKHSRV